MSDGTPPNASKHLRRLGDPTAREYQRRLAATGRPAATRCATCGALHFPPLARCPECGTETEWLVLPARGSLHAFTTQETALRFRAPTVLALAEIGGVVIPGIVEEAISELRIDEQVEIEVRPEPETGMLILVFIPL